MDDFKNCIDECEVSDCPASGSLYTWNNKQDVATRVYSPLDRVLVNQGWVIQKPNVYAHFYCEGNFDHCPCVVQNMNMGPQKRRHFKYYNMWSKSVEFLPCVKTVWDNDRYGTNMFKLTKKLKDLKMPLKNLNKLDFDDVVNNATRARMTLEYIQGKLRDDPLNADLIQQEMEAASALRFLDQAAYEFLTQKSKAVWLEQGDHNTKYFHSLIKSRNAQNKVLRIEDVKGHLCEDTTQIQNAFLDFYRDLL
ncbi:uncharacterized protein LOC141648615 [Silene latifolia]|uniref:uncharacterized protein LOC141648615 n=1 Tax=Silene latifolia TaxID=37657 RepID=UPI003D787DE6